MSTKKKGYEKLGDQPTIQADTRDPIFRPREKNEEEQKSRGTTVLILLTVLFTTGLILFGLSIGIATVYLLIRRLLPIVPDGPTEQISTDCGIVEGFGKNGYFSYLGIPYSVPRTGSQRWQAPVGLKAAGKCWKGVLQTKNYSDFCVQSGFGGVMGSEDCLYLNVYTPEIASTDLPVILWIHGGGFTGGAANLWYGTPEIFAKERNAVFKNVSTNSQVVVSLNYRLGLLGFLSHTVLDEVDPRKVSGNYGILDVLEGLKWINRNIVNFGGDSEMITIMGQSAGASIALALVSMPSAHKYFQKAVVMSQPTGFFYKDINTAQNQFSTIINNSTCKGLTGQSLRTCLYDMRLNELVRLPYNHFFPKWIFGIPPKNPDIFSWPVVDGVTIPLTIEETLRDNKFDYKDILFGWMREENDIDPVTIMFDNTTGDVPWTNQAYINFIRNKFDSYGVSGLSDEVLSHYDSTMFSTPQMAYDQINADIMQACGTLQYARLAAEHHEDIFVYYSNQTTTSERCLAHDSGYCAKYAFHMYDTFCMFGNTEIFELDQGEKDFGKLLRETIITFAKTNVPLFDHGLWSSFQKDESVTLLRSQGKGPKKSRNPKMSVCSFWEKKNLFDWPM